MEEIKDGLRKTFLYLTANISLVALLLLPIIMALLYQDSLWYWLYIVVGPGLVWLIRKALKD